MDQLLPLVISVVVLVVLLLLKVNLGWSLLFSAGTLIVGVGIELVEMVNIVRSTVTDSYFL